MESMWSHCAVAHPGIPAAQEDAGTEFRLGLLDLVLNPSKYTFPHANMIWSYIIMLFGHKET